MAGIWHIRQHGRAWIFSPNPSRLDCTDTENEARTQLVEYRGAHGVYPPSKPSILRR